jgi:hypothetical protein
MSLDIEQRESMELFQRAPTERFDVLSFVQYGAGRDSDCGAPSVAAC